jgi:formylglycine-generating enzyme required for sulfatase activity
MKFRYGKTGLALLAWAIASPGFAQAVHQIKGPGQIFGSYEPAKAYSVKGVRFDCYMLQTQKGERWQIKMKPWTGDVMVALGLAVGSSCTSTRVLDTNTGLLNHAKLNFVSGGGTYFIRAINLFPLTSGTYRLDLSKAAGLATSGFVTPGMAPAAWIMPGWKPMNASSMASAEATKYRPGTVLRDCESTCPEMVVVPAGHFMMGSPSSEVGREANEGPRHEVSIAHPFAVGRYEITYDEYDACTAAGVCPHTTDYTWGRGRRPVLNVSWYDALTYVDWLSRQTGQHYSLLSEAEWEYMARAGTTTPWNTGSAIVTDDANILNVYKQTVPVGGFAPNAFGVYDTHGNAAEWVLDCFDIGYFGTPTDGSASYRSDCKSRVVRSGKFANDPDRVRSAWRGQWPPEERSGPMGIRIARSL